MTHTATQVPKLGRRRTDKSRPVIRLPLLSPLLRAAGPVPPHPAAADHLAQVTAWNGATNMSFGTCVVPSTRVLTADLRWVRAGDLSAGDAIVGFDENAPGIRMPRRYRSAVVMSAEIVSKPCYDLEFEDGTSIRCSDDHKWLTKRHQGEQGCGTGRWAETRHLRCGPVQQSSVLKPLDVWQEDSSREAGYLAGAFDGEGNLDQARAGGRGNFATRLRFVQSDNEMLAEVQRCLKERGYEFIHKTGSGGRRMRIDGTPRHVKHIVDIGRRPQVIRFLGSIRPERLLAKINIDRLGRIGAGETRLVRKTHVGVCDVVKLETSTRTYLAEGLAAHNCGPCDSANGAIMTWKYLLGEDITVSDEAIFDLYRRSGNPTFDPATGAGDGGVDMTVMLAELVRNGMTITHVDGGTEVVRPLLFAAAPATAPMVEAVTSIFGGSSLAWNLDVAQQSQQDLWDYQASPPWGGHATFGGKYATPAAGQAHAADETGISWQRPVGFTDAFMAHQLEEHYVLVWEPLWDTPAFQANVDQQALIGLYEQVTGRAWTGPKPAPSPAPVPPAPVSPPLPADVAAYLADPQLADWASRDHVALNKYAARRYVALRDTYTP